MKNSINTFTGLLFILLGINAAYLFFYLQKPDPQAFADLSEILPVILVLVAFLLAGLGFLMKGIRGFKKAKESNKNYEWLKQNGQKISAKIVNVDQDTSIAINERSPYVLFSQWQDPTSQKIYSFKSDYIWNNPLFILGDKKEVVVLINPQDPLQNFIDLSSVGLEVTSEQETKFNKIFLWAGIFTFATILLFGFILPTYYLNR